MDQYLEFVFSEADVSVVIAVNYDTIRLERWKNTPERMEEHRKLKKGSAQKAFLSGAEHIKSKKILRQTSSCTTKEIEQEPKAEQVKTLEVSHLKWRRPRPQELNNESWLNLAFFCFLLLFSE